MTATDVLQNLPAITATAYCGSYLLLAIGSIFTTNRNRRHILSLLEGLRDHSRAEVAPPL